MAIRQLDLCEMLSFVSAATKLSLAISLRVHHWIRPAVITILRHPRLPFIESDIRHLGARILTDLLMWREKIDALRLKIIAHYPGDVLALECPRPTECAAQIYKCWGAFRLYLHAPLSKFEADLPVRLHSSEVCDNCCTEVMEQIRDARILLAEEDLIKEAAEWMYNRWCIDATDGA